MRLPLTLRIIYHGFRACVRAGLLLILAWLFLIPATSDEALALGASEDVRFPMGLRTMRTARVIVAAAPDRAYVILAMFAGPDISPLLVRIAMVQMAAGNVIPETMVRSAPQSSRGIDGPRFIQVD